MKDSIRRVILAAVLIMIVVVIFQLQKSNAPIPHGVPSEEGNPLPNPAPEKVLEGISYPKAPEFAGIATWINSEPLTLEGLKGKVVLVDFWTYSCINCIRTLPYLKEWWRKYQDNGFVLVGVHTPEFEFEKDTEKVKKAMAKYGVTYPVAQDNSYGTWNAYQNRWWPRKFLIDKDGYIRYDHIGEGGYDETEAKIVELLNEMGQQVVLEKTTVEEIEESQDPLIVRGHQTPELYAGYQFARLPPGNQEGFQPEQTVEYKLPSTALRDDVIYLDGRWKNKWDNLQYAGEGKGKVVLKFSAQSLNIVISPTGAHEVDVMLDGAYLTIENAGSDVLFDAYGRSYLSVEEAQLYNVIGGKNPYGTYTITFETDSNDFAFNSFTFGS